MKTLADLKRDLVIGAQVILIEANSTFAQPHKWLNVPRYVVGKNSVGIQFSPDKNATKGTRLDLPKASLLDYDGDTFAIYESGSRELNETEKRVMDNKPSKRPENQEQLKQDLLSDGSQIFYADRRYLKDNNMEYLSGTDMVRGLYYNFNTGRIDDQSIKGKMTLKYKIIKP